MSIDPENLPANIRRAMDRKPALRVPGTKQNDNLPDRKVPNSKPECHKATALGKTVPRKAPSPTRTVVRFVGFRVRPLDPDNFAGSVKDLLDGLRHASLIKGDEPWRIILETEQVKVATFKEERTEIEITSPLCA